MVANLRIPGVFVLKPEIFYDSRGSFQEIYNESKSQPYQWKQVNCSVSAANVVRGIHRSPYAKLCTCLSGRIWDVVVDLRITSPTYKQWDAAWLEPGMQIFIPAHCGHGFLSVEDNSRLLYLQDDVYIPDLEEQVHWQNPEINITWPEREFYILSEKDS